MTTADRLFQAKPDSTPSPWSFGASWSDFRGRVSLVLGNDATRSVNSFVGPLADKGVDVHWFDPVAGKWEQRGPEPSGPSPALP